MNLPLFDEFTDLRPVRLSARRQQVAPTSAQTYRAIQPTLGHREQVVFTALQECGDWHPTSYELFQVLHRAKKVQDLNDVRPRICELWKRGVIVRYQQRACTVTGRTSYTWGL